MPLSHHLQEFRSIQNGTAKPGILNCFSENELANLGSELTKILTFPLHYSVSISQRMYVQMNNYNAVEIFYCSQLNRYFLLYSFIVFRLFSVLF